MSVCPEELLPSQFTPRMSTTLTGTPSKKHQARLPPGSSPSGIIFLPFFFCIKSNPKGSTLRKHMSKDYVL